jgi:hypothetical protein
MEGPLMRSEWLTTAMLAELKLPGLPATVRSLNRIAATERWAEQTTSSGEPLARRLGSLFDQFARAPKKVRHAVFSLLRPDIEAWLREQGEQESRP